MHTYAYDVYSLFSYTSHDNLLDLEKLRDVMRRGEKSLPLLLWTVHRYD